MRRVSKLGLAVGLIGVLGALSGVVAVAGISGSDHDFSGAGYGTNQICIFCHTPHNANTTVADSPLWNHAVTGATFTLYDSPTLDATTAQPGGVSKLCLSCHDGTVAIDSYGAHVGTDKLVAGDGAYIGTDLSNDHPISFTYDAALATTDGELATPSGGTVGISATKLPLFGTKLECATCHDVHNGPGATGALLRMSNSGSALCLNCHVK